MNIGRVENLEARELTARKTLEKLSLARSLSDFAGIESLLVHQEVVPPGRRTAAAHYHSLKEEIFLVVSGTPSVWIEGEVKRLEPGEFVGFNAREQKAHMLLNLSDTPAVVLTIGTNPPDDEITFVDVEPPRRSRRYARSVNVSVKSLLTDAETLRSQRRMEDANVKLDQALHAARIRVEYAPDVALSLWQVGRLEDTVDLLERSVERLEPSSDSVPTLLTRLGAAHIRLGHLQKAVNILYDALELSDNGYTALQLGNALRYLGEFEEAAGHLTRAFHKAKTERDGALAIAALCAQGELALDEGEAHLAIELFGKGLGLTELSSHEPLSVAPLAGLSQAHSAWDYPKKAVEVGEKALRRAEAAGDSVGKARALLSLGLAKQEVGLLKRSEHEAERAPHHPLKLRAQVARLELAPNAEVEEVSEEARKMGMQPEVKRLQALTS